MDLQAQLTPRETQVAEYLAWGAAKKEVADKLRISTRTVENQARSIYAKIGIQKATELTVWWFCTKLGVSFDLNPLKRGVISALLLLVFLPSVIQEQQPQAVRAQRTETIRTARGRNGGRREDNGETLEF